MPFLIDGIEYLTKLSAGDLGDPLSVDQARALLKSGNQNYMSIHKPPPKAENRPHFKGLIEGVGSSAKYVQRPFAVILCCADSRVSPEIIFDQEQGNLFVVRTAGNTSDPKVISNIAYALHALKVPLIVVMGHQECGAVAAAIDQLDGKQAPDRYACFVNAIVPNVQPTNGREPLVAWESGVRSNVRETASILSKSSYLSVAGAPPTIDMVYYHFKDGYAEFFT